MADDKLVSAEEARRLREAAEKAGSITFSTRRLVTAECGLREIEAAADLITASPRLARTVEHLWGRLAEVEAERDSWREQTLDAQQVAIDTEVRLGLRIEELERALRVENGDPLAGPDGWVPTTRGWRRADMLVTRRWMFGTCVRVAVDEDGHTIEGSVTDHPNAWDAMTRFGGEE